MLIIQDPVRVLAYLSVWETRDARSQGVKSRGLVGKTRKGTKQVLLLAITAVTGIWFQLNNRKTSSLRPLSN